MPPTASAAAGGACAWMRRREPVDSPRLHSRFCVASVADVRVIDFFGCRRQRVRPPPGRVQDAEARGGRYLPSTATK